MKTSSRVRNTVISMAFATALVGGLAACSSDTPAASTAGSSAAASPAAATSAAKPTEAEINALFDQWNASLATLDANKVADNYANDAILLPTVSNEVRSSRAEIVDYFTKDFLPKKPQGVIKESYTSLMDENSAAHSGVYDFTLTDSDGKKEVVGARFTFVYEKVDGKWLIVEHHSSALPEGDTK